ncbi:uncharacterized protein LOC113511884 [Galleria mellonella]|uniref:Uncharacterized protein LOC113511884 n=1 Tax=Galleria mellonella TaxID=7137 RepID=A0A6J1WD32_GALME|nr:uncharacterized protein LOC113511884 [Galleria mellonella]
MFSLPGIIKCYPVENKGLQSNSDFKDEKRYPNGTVVGKYSYTDREGNPIQVKYYADDSSYGIELKSIKIVEPIEDIPQTAKEANLEYFLQNTASPIDESKDSFFNLKYKTKDPLEILNKEIKTNRFKEHSTISDYEIFVENDLKAPKKCGKDKVRIYFDKNKRKIREARNNEKIAKYCELF